MTKKEQLTYRIAADEIDQILAELEDDQRADIDELAEKVERAAKLIRFCFERLKGAELRVEKVTRELSEATGEPDDESDAR